MQRAQTEAVTFLGNQDTSRSLYAIPGLDYVAQEDILPYTATEKQPLQHELFDKFLMYYPNKGISKYLLHYEYQELHVVSIQCISIDQFFFQLSTLTYIYIQLFNNIYY